jgi:hypothetical protein
VTGRKPAMKGRALVWQRRRPASRSPRVARVISRVNRSPITVIFAALVLVLVLGGLGFAIHALWWLALIALVVWLLGFFLRVGETIAKPPRRRWYYW